MKCIQLWEHRITSYNVCYTKLLRIPASTPNASSNIVVVIDAGHGGMDGGCTSVNGGLEKDINLSILLKLRDFCEAFGYKVIVTRDTDVSIHDEGVTGVGNQKRSDMENRLKILNKHASYKLV